MLNVEKLLSEAVSHFWETRASQKERQGGASGVKDAGNRSAVTGGKHADGFVSLIGSIVRAAGISDAHIHTEDKLSRTLPGYSRPAKEWDVVVRTKRHLIAAMEVKSQVGSFGNNFNNRVEEAIGNATDFWAAYRKDMHKGSPRPWLGYMFMLEDVPQSAQPTRPISLNPFPIDEELQGLSYAKRYEQAYLRLVRESLYDAVCFFTSNAAHGLQGHFCQPNPQLDIRNFAQSLSARTMSLTNIK